MAEWPPKLTIETEPVLKLFTGENFYSSADASIREAVLNSIDAIGRRQERDGGLFPRIEVTFDRGAKTVSVDDNGDGMNREDLSNLFTKVGSSAAQAMGKQQGYRAVGEFGIGALSYFLVCDTYTVHTRKHAEQPVGLEFSKSMLDGKTHAVEVAPDRTSIGTTVTLKIKSIELFDLLLQKFGHWMRNVDGLSARSLPDGAEIKQGGLTRDVRTVSIEKQPEWIEEANIGPPVQLNVWDSYDGRARVDILYRGVFVERFEVEQMWGTEGAIHVDPKHFRPKLNREGFVGKQLKEEVSAFLRTAHPAVLERAVECIRELLRERDSWSLNKAITLWLAVPRSASYARAVEAWDKEFRNRKSIRLLGPQNDREVSIAELVELAPPEIYLAPDRIDQSDPIITQAIRVLRATEALVVQGLHRYDGYLSTAPMTASDTSWLLLNAFREELPEIKQVAKVAEKTVAQQALATVFDTAPQVQIVRLGVKSAPIIAVNQQIWINGESEAGKRILDEVCKRNEGHLGLWVACMLHASDQGQRLEQVGSLLRKRDSKVERLGLVKRQYLRRAVQ